MEITIPLQLDEEQDSLLDMHSVLNVLNCINHELLLISELLEHPEEVLGLMDDIAQAAGRLRNPERAMDLIRGADGLIARIEQTVDGARARAAEAKRDEITLHCENLQAIYAIVRIRVREIMARYRSPDAWVEHRVDELKGNFADYLEAIAKNSHGSWGAVQNVEEQGESDYLIQIEIDSDHGETLTMPVIFQDVMRDLLSNARKYTPLGGRIRMRLHATAKELHFTIQDNGMGIPRDSIQEVVLFGNRAFNAVDRVTRGGGFGLTKAYYVTRRYRGRMWIDSATREEGGDGTTIEIRIPMP